MELVNKSTFGGTIFEIVQATQPDSLVLLPLMNSVPFVGKPAAGESTLKVSCLAPFKFFCPL